MDTTLCRSLCKIPVIKVMTVLTDRVNIPAQEDAQTAESCHLLTNKRLVEFWQTCPNPENFHIQFAAQLSPIRSLLEQN